MNGEVWTIHQWWVPDDNERPFMEAWRALAESITGDGLMQRVDLMADIDEPRVHWTPLCWGSQSVRRAWRAERQHREVEEAVNALCDGVRVHRMITVLEVRAR